MRRSISKREFFRMSHPIVKIFIFGSLLGVFLSFLISFLTFKLGVYYWDFWFIIGIGLGGIFWATINMFFQNYGILQQELKEEGMVERKDVNTDVNEFAFEILDEIEKALKEEQRRQIKEQVEESIKKALKEVKIEEEEEIKNEKGEKMPYIKEKERKDFDVLIGALVKRIKTEGELNYVITQLCNRWLTKHEVRYSILNTVVGVLSCVLQEFYRRVVVPYEEKKKEENGDVY